MDTRTILDSGLMAAVRVAFFASATLALAACGSGGGEGSDTATAVGSGSPTQPTRPGASPSPSPAPEAGRPAPPAGGGGDQAPAPEGGEPPAGGDQAPSPAPAPEAGRPAPPTSGSDPAPSPSPAPGGGETITVTPSADWYPVLCQRAHGSGGIVRGQLRWDAAVMVVDGVTIDVADLPLETGGASPNNTLHNPEIQRWDGRVSQTRSITSGMAGGQPRAAIGSTFDGVQQRTWDCSVGIKTIEAEQAAVCFFSAGSFNRGFGPPAFAGFYPSTGELIRWDMQEGYMQTDQRQLPMQTSVPINAQCVRGQ